MASASQNIPLRIVSIGGGNGLSTLLRGLKRYAKAGEGILDITAVVTVTDDGGSSGRLRRDFDVLPPGDIRNCMVALSEDEALLSRLFQFRFSGGRGLNGHSFGNLFLTAMTHLTGDFNQAVRFSAEVLAVLGHIYPSTASNVVIEATLANGRKVAGESRISRSRSRIEKIEIHPRRPKPLGETLEAIAKADLITLGPGSLFTSVIPNLLVDGIPKAIAQSPALKAYFVNLMSQPGETTNFRASDHVEAIHRHTKRAILDVCVVNTRAIRGKVLDRYQASAARPVENDIENLERMGLKVIEADLLRMSGQRVQEKIRHDSGVIGAIAFDLARKGHKRKLKKNESYGGYSGRWTGNADALQAGQSAPSRGRSGAGGTGGGGSSRAGALRTHFRCDRPPGGTGGVAPPAAGRRIRAPAGAKRHGPRAGIVPRRRSTRWPAHRPLRRYASADGGNAGASARYANRFHSRRDSDHHDARRSHRVWKNPAERERRCHGDRGRKGLHAGAAEDQADQFRHLLFPVRTAMEHIGEIEPNPASGEIYLTDMAEILARNGYAVRPMHVDDATELLGINTRVELAAADRVLRSRKNEELMLAGVTIERPETVTIDMHVQAGTDTIIEPFTRLLGATNIGEDCRIGAGAILENAILADGVTVAPYTLINDSRIDTAAQVGPFARLRMDAHVGRDARVGNFVELKKTHLGNGAKSQHLAYLGDSEIGDRVNIGAGTITCNYDGQKKHRTTIGAGAFVGSNSTLVAPVEIGESSYIAAGSVITHEVPADSLALGRSRQVVKSEWVKQRLKKS